MGNRFGPARRPWMGKDNPTPEQLDERWSRLTPAEQRGEERRVMRYYAACFAELGDPRTWPVDGELPDPAKRETLGKAYDDWRSGKWNELTNIVLPPRDLT